MGYNSSWFSGGRHFSTFSFYQVTKSGLAQDTNKVVSHLGEVSAWSSKYASTLLSLLPTQESWKSELQELLRSGPDTSSSSKRTTVLPFPAPAWLLFPLPSFALPFLQQDATKIQHCQCCNCMLSAGLPRISFFAVTTCHLQLALPVAVQSISCTALLQCSWFPPSFLLKLQFPPIPRISIACSTSGQFCATSHCGICLLPSMHENKWGAEMHFLCRCLTHNQDNHWQTLMTADLLMGSGLSIFRYCTKTLNLNWSLRGSSQTLWVTQDL